MTASNDGIEEGDKVEVTIGAKVVDVHDDGALWVDADGVEFEVAPSEYHKTGFNRAPEGDDVEN